MALFFTLIVIFLVIAIWMPKRLSAREIYITWITIVCVNMAVDIVGAHILHLYLFMGVDKVTWQAVVPKLLFSPAVGLIFLNYLPSTLSARWVYALAWTALATVIEMLAVDVGFLTYITWRLWYSALFYLSAFWYIVWHLTFIRGTRQAQHG